MSAANELNESRTMKGITHEQRYDLCQKKQQCPWMKQSDLAAWFKDKYNFRISQPAISSSLKKSAEILSAGPDPPGIDTSRVRKRPVRHPELELAIYQWIQTRQQLEAQKEKSRQEQGILRRFPGSDGFESSADGVKESASGSRPASESPASEARMETITGPVIVREAKRISQEMSIEDIVFCPGWLSRFKARFQIKSPQSRPKASYNQPRHPRRQGEQHSSQRLPLPITTNPNTVATADNNMGTTASSASSATPSSPGSCKPVSSPANSSLREVLDQSVIHAMDIRPSIVVPSTINNSESSLGQFLQHQHRQTNTVALVDGATEHDLITFTSVANQQPQHDHHPQRDRQLLHQYRRHPYSVPPSSHQHPHSHNMYPHPLPSTSSSSSAPSLHLNLTQSIRIARSSVSQARSSAMNVDTDGEKNTSLFETIPSLKDAGRIIQQLRQFVGLNLQDPMAALQSIDTLERELQSALGQTTRVRDSITIAEADDE